jgi:ribosome-associated protein
MTDEPAAAAAAPGRGRHGRENAVRDDGIRLGQLLKLADLAATGAEAKALLAEGSVQVGGQVEVRRGRQLARGDVVQVGAEIVRLV